MTDFFKGIPVITYEGPGSDNDFAFRHYNPDEIVMGKAMKMCKKESPTRDILRECWGLSPLALEEAWREWVLEEYAPTNKR